MIVWRNFGRPISGSPDIALSDTFQSIPSAWWTGQVVLYIPQLLRLFEMDACLCYHWVRIFLSYENTVLEAIYVKLHVEEDREFSREVRNCATATYTQLELQQAERQRLVGRRKSKNINFVIWFMPGI